MKKWITSVFASAVLAISMGAVAMAHGQNEGVGEYCKPLAELYGVSNDLCVNCVNPSEANRSGEGAPTCICKNAGPFGGEPYLGYDNLGQCVSSLHAMGY